MYSHIYHDLPAYSHNDKIQHHHYYVLSSHFFSISPGLQGPPCWVFWWSTSCSRPCMCSKTPLTIRVMINDHVYDLSIVIMSSRSGYISWTTDDGGKDFHLLLMRRPPAISIPGKTILQTNNVKMMKLLATCYQTWALVINSNIVLREIEITWQGRHVRGCEANKSSRGCVVESPKVVLMRTFKTIVRGIRIRLRMTLMMDRDEDKDGIVILPGIRVQSHQAGPWL